MFTKTTTFCPWFNYFLILSDICIAADIILLPEIFFCDMLFTLTRILCIAFLYKCLLVVVA